MSTLLDEKEKALLTCAHERFKWFQYHHRRYLEMPAELKKEAMIDVREYYVAAALGEGLNGDITQQLLGISKRTLKRVKSDICEKLLAKNLTHAVVIIATQTGIGTKRLT